MTSHKWTILFILNMMISTRAFAIDWCFGEAYKLPSQYTNQESGYFSIVEGHNGNLYIGAAKYGVNGYLLEYNPRTSSTTMVMDVQKVIDSQASGFAAQAKIHTRNNVGESGIIYVGSKQGYPEKGESRQDYPGGYVLTYDPRTGRSEHYGIARPHEGIISVIPDESRGVVYLSTCSDDRPIEKTHFMMLDMKTKKYRDFGDCQHSYAFVVLDHQRRAYHPQRGGTILRYDPRQDRIEQLTINVDDRGVPSALSKDGAIQNWDTNADGKLLYCVEMTTNQLYVFDLTQPGSELKGRSLGPLLKNAKATDCRAMCVGPDGRVWMAVTEHQRSGGPLAYLIMAAPGQSPVNLGPIGVKNPDYTSLVTADGKPKPWHHTLRKEADGTLTPWQPMGIAAARDGTVYVMTIAPFTLLKFDQFRPKK